MANDTAKRLLTRIRELRVANGYTQETFAERAGLTYKHYQQVEAGRKQDVRISTLIKIAQALGVELWQLFKFDIEPAALIDEPVKVGRRAAAKTGTGKAVKRRSGTER